MPDPSARPAFLIRSFPSAFAALILAGCGDPAADPGGPARTTHLFREVSADGSGIHFANVLTESPEVNYFTYVYAYNGGGVAAGDLNNDGLTDLYFTGNQVSDRLYLNRGALRFEDVTTRALGDAAGGGWRNGVALADVNADGWLDIYVCRGGPTSDSAMTRNLLHLSQGAGADGVPTYVERAVACGIADTTHSTQAAFLDHDKDGDLDLFVMNTPADRIRDLTNISALKRVMEHKAPTSRLYRNDGPHAGPGGTMLPRFTDVTYEADVQSFTYGLGLSVADIDGNGWPDVYTACDFDSPDLMYMNTGNGRFAEQLQGRTRHISNFGMGSDIADINNDALPDIVVLDMTAPDHLRNKTNMGSMSPERFWGNVRGGYFFQYMVNTLQLNNGNGSFSEIGQLAGIARTDWSWAPLLADLDNDGWKDLLVTNGYKHDVRNNDYARTVFDSLRSGTDFYNTLDLIPSTRLHNYLFRNNGDLTFSDSTAAWGFTKAVNSNGAAYADLDNDGDLDLVINHIDDVASLYENTSNERADAGHWLQLDLRAGTVHALGAKAIVRVRGSVQYQELYPVRGYQSSVDPVLHFGLGTAEVVDTLEIHWPDGSYTLMEQVKADRRLALQQEDASAVRPMAATEQPLFDEVTLQRGLEWRHMENPYDDFKREVLLPHKQSEFGPLLGVGDANGDGRDDLFAGGAHGQASILFLQQPGGSFAPSRSQPWKEHAAQEQLGSLFFDADGDGDQDLLVLAGSNEHDVRDAIFQQRLYINNGQGDFSAAQHALPPMSTSAMRAATADVDADGDADLFIGGRTSPGYYPFPPRSYLLLNDGHGTFSDATEAIAPDAMGPGMITACAFTDLDHDRDPDLVLAGEWMPITVLRNTGGRFRNATAEFGLEGTSGWWYSLAVADVNGDGHQDLIGGNLGWNSKFQGTPEHPVHVYWADFDDNGRSDIVLAKEKGGVQLPVRGRECSSQQCPVILDRFPTYEQFAMADLQRIYTPEKLEKALHLQAGFMRSAVFLADGSGHFTPKVLPNLAQVAPINAIVPLDVNGDGILDLIAAGNNWGAEVETVRYDAGTGLILLGDNTGSFRPMPVARGGFLAGANVKDLALLRTGTDGRPLIVVANNNDVLQAFAPVGAPLSALAPR